LNVSLRRCAKARKRNSVSPFQGSSHAGGATQGVALGYHIWPRWGQPSLARIAALRHPERTGVAAPIHVMALR